MESTRVEEIMVPLDQYPNVRQSDTLREAITEMEKCQIIAGDRKSLPRAVLVFNDRGDLVGIARRRDILRGLEPEFLSHKPLKVRKSLFDIEIDPNLMEMSYEQIEAGLKQRAKQPVSEVTLPIEATIDINDHIIKAIYEMVSANVAVLPVLSGDQVVGVIRTADVFHEVAGILLDPSEVEAGCSEE
jgi:predicted transcriptional regulator